MLRFANAVPLRVAGITLTNNTFKFIPNKKNTSAQTSARSAVQSRVVSLLGRVAAAVVSRSVPPTTTTTTTTTTTVSNATATTSSQSPATNTTPADPVTVLRQVLDLCAAAEQRASSLFSVASSSSVDNARVNFIPTALMVVDVALPLLPRANVSIVGSITTDYPALVRSLQVLKIYNNHFDESAALGAFAALATDLQELTLNCCGLASVQGLEGRCEYLRKVNLYGCEHLSSLEGLGDGMRLEEVNVSWTAVTSIEPLRTCPALTNLNVWGCQQLSSIDALNSHQWLKEVDASQTSITSIEPLRTCPALTKANLRGCQQLVVDVDLPAMVKVLRY